MRAPRGEKSSKKMPNEKFSTTTRDDIAIEDENSRFTRSKRTLELLRSLASTKLVTALVRTVQRTSQHEGFDRAVSPRRPFRGAHNMTILVRSKHQHST